jgi:integral membrane protein (TIGR01906 family)
MRIEKFSFLLIALFPLFLLSVSVFSVAFDEDHYATLFQELQVYEAVPDAKQLNHDVLEYLSGKGALPTVLNDRERAHMQDVQRIFIFLKTMLIVTPLLFIFLIFIGYGKNKDKQWLLAAQVAKNGALATLVIIMAVALSIALSFSASFSVFHSLFFKEGTYLFDPSTEVVVQLYPEQLFYSVAMKIALFTAILGLLALSFGHCVQRKDIKKKAKGIGS